MPQEKLTTLYLDLSRSQLKEIKQFLAKRNIYCDGKKEFALLAVPYIYYKTMTVKLLTPKQHKKISTLFDEMKLREE